MLQNPHVLVTFQWMHNPLHLPHKTTSERPKCLRDPQFLTLLTSKCASRHNAVHFFDISTSKSAPRPPVFNTFYFQMCFAPQRRALFRHLNFQNCSEPLSFLTHFTSKCASRHNAVHFFNISTSKSGPTLRCFVPFHFEISFAPRHNGVQLFLSHLPRCLRTRRFGEPTFQPSGATKPRKNTVFRDFPTFSRTCIFFLLIFSLLTLLPADCFFISPYCRKFDF